MPHHRTVSETDIHKFQTLREQISACRYCREDFGFEPRPILFGNLNARIMQISQAPSRSVYHTGKPFYDASGRRLRSEWYQIPDEIFYDPDNFYIVSVAHCYPGKAPGGGDRRPPKCCAAQWLRQELALVQNDIYILIGGYAASYFFPGEKLTDLVFRDLEIQGKKTLVLPHPSPLNMKWFRDHPEFQEKRVKEVSRIVHEVLGRSS